MNGSIAAIVTLGFGTFGSVGLTVTVGYGSGGTESGNPELTFTARARGETYTARARGEVFSPEARR